MIKCKETFKLRLNQQKRGGSGKRSPAKKRAYDSDDDEEEEEDEDVKPSAPKKTRDDARIKYLEEVVVSLQGRILELSQQLEMKSAPKCEKDVPVEPEIKLENGFTLVSLDSSVDLSQLDVSSPYDAFDFLRQHDNN